MLRFLCVLSLSIVTGCASTIEATAPVAPLRIATWNMEHLAGADGSGCKPRTEADYAALRETVDRLNADVIAFQEVESEAAAQRVFDPSRYTIAIEQRAGSGDRLECRGLPGQYLNRQAVGFAIRHGLEIERRPDVTAVQLGDANLRSAVDIEVGHVGGQRLRLLAVHLKSGCASASGNGDACSTLFAQMPVIEAWIDARASGREDFIVLGDFNRRLATPSDAVWADLDDAEPLASDLFLASGDIGATCDPRYPAFIDHIVAPERSRGAIVDFREWVFEGPRLSDHCPISVTFAPTR